MQKIIYECDQCQNEIEERKHLSLVMAGSEHCGVAVPPNIPEKLRDGDIYPAEIKPGVPTRTYWKVNPKGIKGRFFHFCTPQCMMRYFSARIKEAL